MKTSLRSITATAFYITGITSAILTTGVDTTYTNNLSKLVCTTVICFAIALTLTYLDKIRRITYPSLVCLCAWIYKHRIAMTKFTRNAFRIYKMTGHSYSKLYDYTQDLFDSVMQETM